MSDEDHVVEDQAAESAPRALDPRMLESLVCPVTHGPLRYDREKGELLSPKARLAFPIREGVPVMLESEARELEDGEA